MVQNQMALVFTFGPSSVANIPAVEIMELHGNGLNVPKTSKLTVIFNNGPEYLKGLWGSDFKNIIEIVNEIISFSWLPQNFIGKEGTGLYHRNQLLELTWISPFSPNLVIFSVKNLAGPTLKTPTRIRIAMKN